MRVKHLLFFSEILFIPAVYEVYRGYIVFAFSVRMFVCLLTFFRQRFLKSNSHAPNLLVSIIYSRLNIVRVYYFADANANTHGT